MKLPNAGEAHVERAKVVDYLLSTTHPDGAPKAAFFLRFGFSVEKWQVMAEALCFHARDNDVGNSVASSYGVRYTVDGVVQSPDGRNPLIRSVWIVEKGSRRPRLITAHPLQE
jgi:hypothetical protein